MLLEWRKEFQTGIPSVDYEHQELIDLINRAHAEMEAQSRDVADFIGEIYARISLHFALEEQTMRAHDYGHYAEHKADHERLLDELRDIMDEYDGTTAFDATALGERLRDWFAIHFKTHDAWLHYHLNMRRAH